MSSLQQNTLTENTRLQWRSSGHLVSRQNIGIFFLCGKNQLILELYFFEVCKDTILVFPCDCVTVLPPIERSKPLFLEREGNPLICWKVICMFHKMVTFHPFIQCHQSWRAVSQLEMSSFEPGAFRIWFFPSHVSGLGVIEIYMLALAWRWIWWAPAIVSVLISEYWAQNRGQIHDMECQKSRCHFFVFARFNYIFSVFMSGSSQIHNLECQRLDNI